MHYEKNKTLNNRSRHTSQSPIGVPRPSVTYNQLIVERKGNISKYYQVLESVGKGAFGEVKKVLHKLTKDIRAMKIIKKDKCDKNYLNNLYSEINILKQMDHPNIVKLYEIFSDSKHLYLITEYLEGGELFDLILKQRHFTEHTAAKIMKQVLSAVHYCHQRKIVHRDLKPENLLLVRPDDFEIKVIDFGLAREFQPKQNMCSRMGTPFYIAPEVLKKKYTEKCDVWSCGVILYILLCGQAPFNGRTEQQIYE